MTNDEQKVLQFPNLCHACKRVAEVNDHGAYFCETCYQHYEQGSLRLKRVLYQIQRHAKMGRVQLKGIALTQEGKVGLRMSLNTTIPHSFESEQEKKTGVEVTREKIQPEQKTLPSKRVEEPKKPIKPLVLKPIDADTERQATTL